VRFSLDTSGNLLSLFNKAMPVNEDGEHTIWSTPYAQYVRAELNLGKTFRFGGDNEHAIALHLMAGAGYGYGNSTTMPVEKQFYCGGSSSMRGWQARTLGPGNSQLITVFSIPTQIGEMKLEANVEYRFPIVWKLEGALFADAGNIWNMPRPADYDYVDDDDKLGVFDIKNFAGSIGLDWGLGIRVNLGFLLIRLDGGLRLHDPARAAGNRWVPVREWFPKNYAIHFGVGYPF
jgi:outer membrane protein assembly factor BamA